MIIIGYSKRVRDDVIPVLNLLDINIEQIYTKNPCKYQNIKTYSINLFGKFINKNIYISVKNNSLFYIYKLLILNVRKSNIYIDTPGFSYSSLLPLLILSFFNKIYIVEDVICIPWVKELNKFNKIKFKNCLYIYHGSAILRKYSYIYFRFNKKYFSIDKSFEINGPRDYSNSSISVDIGGASIPILNIQEDGMIGYSIGESKFLLDDCLTKTFLLKESKINKEVTKNMHDWKRIGLYLYFRDGANYTILDSIIDNFLGRTFLK